MDKARAAAEQAARASYGRILSQIARVSGDIAAAEDALSEALIAALTRWPDEGVPDSPDAWLLTVARRRALNVHRHNAVQTASVPELLRRLEYQGDTGILPDRRLELLFACAHPAIDPGIRTPLMLQSVLGLTAERIARAYAEPAAALAQRLVRAKRKIRHSGIPFEEPQPEDLSARLTDVLEAVYAAFGQSWEDAEAGLSVEALYLGDLIAKALPESAEAKGLLSLMCHVEARRPARRDARGQFVPLDLQDSALWSRPLLLRAEGLLHGAARLGQTGRFQVEAAIQSVHAGRAFGAEVSLEGLLALHDKLLAIAPSLGASVSRASVLLRLGHLDEARRALEHLEGVECYQPYWVLRAELGDAGAPEKALALTEDGAVRAYLADRFRVLAT